MTKLKRIFIIGHPGAGKAVFAMRVAESLGYEFVDADLGLEAKIGLPLQQIIGETGIESYEEAYLKVLETLLNRTGIIVVLDGYLGGKGELQSILANECVIYLQTDVEAQMRRSIRNQQTLLEEQSLEQLYTRLQQDRNTQYETISSFTLDASVGDLDDHVRQVEKYISLNNYILEKPIPLKDKDMLFFKKGTDIPIQLSPQQAICFKLIAQGLSSKEISKEMNLSHRTIEGYIEKIKEKLGCVSSKELIGLYHGKI